MNKVLAIMVLGSGAREHAIIKCLSKTEKEIRLYCYSSTTNLMIKKHCVNYYVGNMSNVEQIVTYAKACNIDYVIIGPEAPLEIGVSDALDRHGIFCCSPHKEHAKIETSKIYARDLVSQCCLDMVPRYKCFDALDNPIPWLKELGSDYVVKYDGLMGGKGVKVSGDHLNSYEEVIRYMTSLKGTDKKFIIEEKLIGEEFSLMSFCDSKHIIHMPLVQDHKRAFENDKGPNTGGMGSYSEKDHSLPFLNENDVLQAQKCNEKVFDAINKQCNIGYKGILYGGFMAVKDGIKLIEYNARFGDPEVLNLLSLLQTDMVEIVQGMANSTLHHVDIKFKHQASVCKYMVPQGYPDSPMVGAEIEVDRVPEDQLYIGSVDVKNDTMITTSSRAVACVGIANTIDEAEKKVQSALELIKGPLFYRADIGKSYIIKKKVERMREIRQK